MQFHAICMHQFWGLSERRGSLRKGGSNPGGNYATCLRLMNFEESTPCNDSGHSTNIVGVCIDWFLHLEDSNKD